MQSHYEYVGQVLDEARAAYSNDDYKLSLEKYEWFFEHALDEDNASFYGVRLSYCLSEWMELGKKYPEADLRLQAIFHECLERLDRTRKPEYFHDYVSISKYLNQTPKAVSRFIHYHNSDTELAKSILPYVWPQLIESEAWEVCNSYVEDHRSKYAGIIGMYHAAIGVCNSNPDLGGEDFENQIRGKYVSNVSNLLAVLVNNRRYQEEADICQIANTDIDNEKISVPLFTVCRCSPYFKQYKS